MLLVGINEIIFLKKKNDSFIIHITVISLVENDFFICLVLLTLFNTETNKKVIFIIGCCLTKNAHG